MVMNALKVLATLLSMLTGTGVGTAVDQAGESNTRRRVGLIYSPESSSSGRLPDSAGPIPLRPGPHLFIDDHLIDSSDALIRKVNCPDRNDPSIRNPIVNGRTDRRDCNEQPFLTVLRDPETGRFRMWYNAVNPETQWRGLGYMESEDAIHWIRPHRELQTPHDVRYALSVYDEGPDYPLPDRRYKFAYYPRQGGGLKMAVSGDGLEWLPTGPGLTIGGIGDIFHLARDPIRGQYLAMVKLAATPIDGYEGESRTGGIRRLVGQSVSQDMIDWSQPKRIIMPGPQDEGITEFYGIGGVITRGDLMIGTLKVLRDDLPADPGGAVQGIGYTVLAWTRDGEKWVRDREPFIDRNRTPDAWDHAHAWIDRQLPMGDQIYLYYGGYQRGHKIERYTERQIGLLRMKRDRYVAREAGDRMGTLRTPPVVFHGERLTLNVDAENGEVRVQLTDLDDTPIAGFAFSDCQPIDGNHRAAAVCWKRSLSEVKGKAARLELQLRHARLFGLDLK